VNTRWVTASGRTEALAALGIGEVAHRCPRCGAADHGQPFAEGVALSLSHAGGVTLAALSEGPVGIDHEPLGVNVPRDVVAHPSETDDPLRLWVRKEAVLKATGLGLRIDPTSFWIDESGQPGGFSGYDGPQLTVVDLDVAGFIAVIALTEPVTGQPGTH